jgi:tight adherence protein C
MAAARSVRQEPMVEFVEAFMNPQLLVTLLAAAAAFATVLTVTMPILSRDRMAYRMRSMAVERDKMRAARMAEFGRESQGRLRQTPKGFMQEIVNRLNLRKAFDTDEVRDLLKMAGLRGQAPLVTYMFFRLVMPIVVTFVALIYLFAIANFQHPPIAKFGMAIAAGYAGFYLPNVFLKNLVQKRQASITQAFPDALDMLLICVQAGMSIEAAFGKVSKEVSSQSLELAEEFSLTTAELSYLQDRRIAFENLGKRTGIAGIKAVATALIQAERYGTPVGQALRVMAKENRDMRMSEAERKAAALPPKLTVPMIVFFLPVLFVVILGPAIIQVLKLN